MNEIKYNQSMALGDYETVVNTHPLIKFESYFIGYERFSAPLFDVNIYPYFVFPKIEGGYFIISEDKKYLILQLNHFICEHRNKTYIFDFETLGFCVVEKLEIKNIVRFNFPLLTYQNYQEEVSESSIKYQVWHSFKEFNKQEIGGYTDLSYLKNPERIPENYILYL